MHLNLKATNIAINNDLRLYLEKRLQTLGKFIPLESPEILIDAELGQSTKHHQSGDIFFAEINIHRGKETFRAVSERPDIQSAIDDMRNEIGAELLTKKEKSLSFLRRGGIAAKAVIKGGYDGLYHLGRSGKARWKYLKSFRPWRKG